MVCKPKSLNWVIWMTYFRALCDPQHGQNMSNSGFHSFCKKFHWIHMKLVFKLIVTTGEPNIDRLHAQGPPTLLCTLWGKT